MRNLSLRTRLYILWRNPVEACPKCLDLKDHFGFTFYSPTTKSGFNKGHRHKVNKIDYCNICNNSVFEYDWDDLKSFKVNDITHYTPKFAAKTIAQKEKENQMVATAAPAVGKAGEWYWHVHHQVLAEQLTAPLTARIQDIKDTKQAKETRLHFMQKVINPPKSALGDVEAVAAAQVTYNAIKAAYNRGNAEPAALNKASKRLDAAKAVGSKATVAEWEALHKKECYHYCPWDGKTLLPTGKVGKI